MYGVDGFCLKKKFDNLIFLVEKIIQYMEEKVVFKGEVKLVCLIFSGNVEVFFCDYKGRLKFCIFCVDDVFQLMFELQVVFNELYKFICQ